MLYPSIPMYCTMLLESSAFCTNLRMASRSVWLVTARPFISSMMDFMETTGTCMAMPSVAMPSSGSYRSNRWIRRSCARAARSVAGPAPAQLLCPNPPEALG